ncbi:MarR family transcriptional regulator [Chelatococcus sp. SYSU_G07232]|uniref:MarR family transcriptional regulator n=1 Tax=Chelatococcus albus TaxID=3047466 RepID=A0ABT7AHX4_9HYPH|nr:MarR family transcriptional regulator [Chelatococcus sp. SYSU_G07232]MDJ1158963.1 MarR family transcriptional regulator [Chelatococcus sp. SYSU_G07232]
MTAARTARRHRTAEGAYVLDEQVGFILRQVSQRHATIFAAMIGDELTPTQWAALAKLLEKGPTSQNLLGRQTAMDAATIKGVVDRLTKRGLTETRPDPRDARRLVVALTEAGRTVAERARIQAEAITEETLAPLTAEERATLVELLKKLR